MAQGPPGDAGPPDDVDAGPPDNVTTGPPDNVTTGPPENVTRGPSENVTVGPPDGVAKFVSTSPLAGPDKVDPVSLSGKIRVESQHLENTTAKLLRNSSTDYTLNITVTGNATNVTFFLQKQAVEASQNISNVTMEVDGEPAEFGVNDSGGDNWIVFEIEHFSTRTVTFTSDGAGVDNGGGGSAPDVGDGPPADGLPDANPFVDQNNNPKDRSDVISAILDWNDDGEVDGQTFSREELINAVVQWNMAQS